MSHIRRAKLSNRLPSPAGHVDVWHADPVRTRLRVPSRGLAASLCCPESCGQFLAVVAKHAPGLFRVGRELAGGGVGQRVPSGLDLQAGRGADWAGLVARVGDRDRVAARRIADAVGPATRPTSAAADASTPANRSAVRRHVKRFMTLPFRQNQPAIRTHGAASLAVTGRGAEPQSLPRQPDRRAVVPARTTMTRRPRQSRPGAQSQPCISSAMTREPTIAAPRHRLARSRRHTRSVGGPASAPIAVSASKH